MCFTFRNKTTGRRCPHLYTKGQSYQTSSFAYWITSDQVVFLLGRHALTPVSRRCTIFEEEFLIWPTSYSPIRRTALDKPGLQALTSTNMTSDSGVFVRVRTPSIRFALEHTSVNQ